MSERLTHMGESGPRMVEVGDKATTQRRAKAEAVVRVGAELAEAIRAGATRKGDVLEVAQLAGIQAVKRTADAIPLCHPLPIDGVDVVVRLIDDRVVVEAEVRTSWKTGVEMEALHAASIAALTVIDMGKSIERGLGIESVRLIEKTGGAKGDYTAKSSVEPESPGDKACLINASVWPKLRAAVLTVSDRASSGAYKDRGGPAVADWLRKRVGDASVETAIVTDDAERIRSTIVGWCDAWSSDPSAGLILTTGGTGMGSRDVTPEAVMSVCDRLHPGLVELARDRTGRSFPMAYLSRGVAGLRGRALVIALPGSPKGAVEWLDALEPVLPHGLSTLVSSAEHGPAA
ncbi:MAG: bifunctional molybdenum cofactor biosynthesis protein MoaC/MoaB [Planctomycetota bacterium]